MNIISQNQSSQYNNRSDKVVVIPLCAACHLLKFNAKIGSNMKAVKSVLPFLLIC